MTIAAAPIVEGLGDSVEGLGSAASSAGSAGASNAGPKSKGSGGLLPAAAGGSTAAKLLPKPKTSHPYIVGLILIAVGVAGIIGSVTGQLPAMITALFDPNVLVDKQDATPGIVGDIAKAAESVVDPASVLKGIIP